MELWIRSQNKKRLIKANEIYLDNIYYDDGTVDILVNEFIFGRYVEERALEVLDEIQDLLQNAYVGNLNRIVYQMPEE